MREGSVSRFGKNKGFKSQGIKATSLSKEKVLQRQGMSVQS